MLHKQNNPVFESPVPALGIGISPLTNGKRQRLKGVLMPKCYRFPCRAMPCHALRCPADDVQHQSFRPRSIPQGAKTTISAFHHMPPTHV
jgi:hypothetical protein